MKTGIIAALVAVVLGLGAWYYLNERPAPSEQAVVPNGNAGVNGSPNQGNLGSANDSGMPDNGVQQPGADGAEGSIIGSNLALGTDGNATLGNYLIAYNGMTLYTYSKDTGSASTCYGTCATNWPPYVVGPEDNINNIKATVTGKVGTTVRTDGKIQVTYNGHPLYFYIADKASGDVKGQGVGGVWYVVKP